MKTSHVQLQHFASRFKLIEEGINAGIWDWDILTGEEWWTPYFYKILGYETNEIPASYDTFMNFLIYPNDKVKVDKAIQDHLNQQKPYKIEIRLLNKDGNYRWYESTGQAEWDTQGSPIRMAGSIIDVHERKLYQQQLEKSEALLNEAGKVARLGSWEYSRMTSQIYWSDVIREMYEIPSGYNSHIDNILDYFDEAFQPEMIQLFENTIRDKKHFDIEILCKATSGRKFWTRTSGWPVVDASGNVTAIRGIMQDIDDIKKKEIELSDIPKITDQNNRLLNFAHIVSHNLRSHSGNLTMLIETYKKMQTENERAEIMQMLETTANNLSETLVYLNEIVSIQSSASQQQEYCDFSTYLKKNMQLLEGELLKNSGIVDADFNDADGVEYVPAYMDSLFLNMLTNAIKYRKPNVPPVIQIKSGITENRTWISFQDNGLGIDLNRHGSKIFGMYKTFHRNRDARGVGLFITRNQIDSLGGEITVSSNVGEGTCFTAYWKS